MNPPPKTFVRINDGERFTINQDGSYSLEWTKLQWPHHWHPSWDLDVMLALCQGESASFQIIPCQHKISTTPQT